VLQIPLNLSFIAKKTTVLSCPVMAYCNIFARLSAAACSIAGDAMLLSTRWRTYRK